ncbi:MAG: MBL fold metallo-hydrolase [Actinobacteria bacterium]|nr:MBL fold metallo-hydrolase [Actinomycetota bacterium]
MQLTVLGSAASYPEAGRACAGYLVRSGETTILLDCGNGVLSNLGRVMDPTVLSAVFVSHGHVDHFADVYGLQAALRYAPAGPMPPLPLYLPVGLFARMSAILSPHGAAELDGAFRVHEYADAESLQVDGVTVTPRRVDHADETFAFVVEADGVRLCYTADTRPGAAVLAAACGAHLLLADATLPPEFAGRAPHMTAAEAGALAREAGVHTLALTHLWPGVDRTAAAEEAREAFGGRVIVADEMATFDIRE